MKKESYFRRVREPLIKEEDSIEKLDGTLKSHYGYGIEDFYLSFLWIGFKESGEMTDKDIALIKRLERKKLRFLKKSWEKKHISSGESDPGIMRQILCCMEQIRRCQKQPRGLLRIFEPYRIASVWASFIKDKGKPNWQEIYNLMRWFMKNKLSDERRTEFEKAKGMEDPELLKKGCHNFKKHHNESAKYWKYMCFKGGLTSLYFPTPSRWA
jgi:hypothetical protein